MSEKGGDSMSASKGKRGFFVKLLCFVLALAAGGALGVGGTLFFQWQALPPPEEVFPYWYEPPAPVREESGVTVTLTEANRKHTGAGTLAYTLKNDTEQPLSFPCPCGRWTTCTKGSTTASTPVPTRKDLPGRSRWSPARNCRCP